MQVQTKRKNSPAPHHPKTCFSTDEVCVTTHHAHTAPLQTPASSWCLSWACSMSWKGFTGTGCCMKGKTDFSKHPLSAGKREEWKGNGRSNLERRKEKREALAQRRAFTTPSAMPSSIEDVCFYKSWKKCGVWAKSATRQIWLGWPARILQIIIGLTDLGTDTRITFSHGWIALE